METFCFHSLRAGMIISALFKGNSQPGKINAILEKTAWVAGWDASRRNQQSYVKDGARRNVNATALVDDEFDDDAIIASELCTPEEFHTFVIEPPRWNILTNFHAFSKKVFENVTSTYTKSSDQHSSWMKKFLNFLVSCDDEFIDKAREFKSDNNSFFNAKVQMGQRLICDSLSVDYYDRLFENVNIFSNWFFKYEIFKTLLSRNKRKRDDSFVPSRPLNNMKRIRIQWSNEETILFVSLMKNKLQLSSTFREWRSLVPFFPNRTNVDLKDKWVTLLRKFKNVEYLFTHFL